MLVIGETSVNGRKKEIERWRETETKKKQKKNQVIILDVYPGNLT